MERLPATVSSATAREGRTRSVDNLQRLYTVVVSLAVTGLLTRVFVGSGSAPRFANASLSDWLMVVSFMFTVVPFYHGANRYLDASYVTGERSAKRYGLLFDFWSLFVEAVLFFVLAIFVGDMPIFYSILAGLLLWDAVWVLASDYLWKTDPRTPEGAAIPQAAGRWWQRAHYIWWTVLNIVSALLILLFVWSNLWPTDVAKSIGLAILLVLRAISDYALVWPFYYPPERAS